MLLKYKTVIFWVLSIVGIGGVTGLGFWYFKYSQNKIVSLRVEAEKNIVKMEGLENELAQMKDELTEIKSLREAHARYVTSLDIKMKDLEKVLYRNLKSNKSSLEEIALKDDLGRIESRINKSVKRNLRCLELITGAGLRKNEKADCITDSGSK